MTSPRASARHPARLALLMVACGLAIGLLAPARGRSQDLEASAEMRLQADRFYEQGRYCDAAQRYRAVVGEHPELFRRYAESRAACLRQSSTRTSDRSGASNR